MCRVAGLNLWQSSHPNTRLLCRISLPNNRQCGAVSVPLLAVLCVSPVCQRHRPPTATLPILPTIHGGNRAVQKFKRSSAWTGPFQISRCSDFQIFKPSVPKVQFIFQMGSFGGLSMLDALSSASPCMPLDMVCLFVVGGGVPAVQPRQGRGHRTLGGTARIPRHTKGSTIPRHAHTD